MSSAPARGAAVLVAVLALLVGLAGAARPAAASGTSGNPGTGVTLLGQSPWVRTGHVFTLRLAVPASERGHGQLRLAVTPALTSRSDFDEAAAGNLPDTYTLWSDVVPLTGSAGGGVVTLHIPVGMASSGSELPSFPGSSASGVYPVQIQLENSIGATVGPALTTFLVEDAGTAGYQRLTLALTVPVGTAASASGGALSAGAVAGLSAEVAAMAASPVPLTISIAPRTLADLGSAPGGSSVQADLRALVAAGDEVLPATWADADVPAMVAGGLGAQVADQLATGTSTEAEVLGRPVDRSTWVVSGYDDAGLGALVGLGLRQAVVPSSELSPLTSALTRVTYGLPTRLAGVGAGVRVVAADPVLSARTVQTGGPVLAAEQTLAELAQTQLELPGEARAVAVVPPDGASLSPAYLATLLRALHDDPFVQASTTAGLFGRFPVDPHAPVQHLTTPSPAALDDSASILALDADATSVATVVPGDTALAAALRQALLEAPDRGLSPTARTALLASATQRITRIEQAISFPDSASVTLTSLAATLPLTIVSTSPEPLHVTLQLSSQKLDFRTYVPSGPGGACSHPQRGEEICQLVVSARQTTLKIPVESRTSGAFALQVDVRSPDGRLALASEHETVRSTAVSFVGIIIIVGALVSLGLWWIRDLRSGRRARQLVARPEEDLDDGDGDDPGEGGTGPEGDAGPPKAPVGDRPLPRPTPAPPQRIPAGVGPPASRRAVPATVTIHGSRRSNLGRAPGGHREEPRP